MHFMDVITVCIASIGRPHLIDTLLSLEAIKVPDGFRVLVVIADDSPDGSVEVVLAGFTSRFTVLRLHPGSRNISIARNACLDHARGEWIAFLDDDETVSPDWLVDLLDTAREFEADCVLAPVHPVYPKDTPDWFALENPLFQDWGWHEHGREHPQGRSGNTLVRRALIETHRLRFDASFGRTGGEDTEFFERCHQLGAKMVVTNRAAAREEVPADRVTTAYVHDRCARTGQIYARVKHQSADMTSIRWMGFILGTFLKLGASLSLYVATAWWGPRLRLRFGAWVASNRGKLREVFGHDLPVIDGGGAIAPAHDR
jgi:succinoglycan biosynthesis protein ExoM